MLEAVCRAHHVIQLITSQALVCRSTAISKLFGYYKEPQPLKHLFGYCKESNPHPYYKEPPLFVWILQGTPMEE